MTFDWDSDPELKAMRAGFIASLAERRDLARKALSALRSGAPEAIADVIFIAHKVAGAAESFGFPTVSQVAAAIEEALPSREKALVSALAEEPGLLTRALGLAELLDELLTAAAGGKDPVHLSSDPRYRAIALA